MFRTFHFSYIKVFWSISLCHVANYNFLKLSMHEGQNQRAKTEKYSDLLKKILVVWAFQYRELKLISILWTVPLPPCWLCFIIVSHKHLRFWITCWYFRASTITWAMTIWCFLCYWRLSKSKLSYTTCMDLFSVLIIILCNFLWSWSRSYSDNWLKFHVCFFKACLWHLAV